MNQHDENGKAHGPWEYFHSNGALWQKGSYGNGTKKGTWIEQWNQQ